MKNKIFAVILFILVINYGNSQEIITIKSIVENQLEINLYRGIVEVDTCKCDSIRIEHQIYDYDAYINSGKINVIEEKERSFLKISRLPNKILIANDISRNIQKIVIYVPLGVNVKIDINHYGEINFKKGIGEIEAQIFQGTIIGNIANAISVTVIRNGAISLNIIDPNFELAFLSIYNGPVNIQTYSNFNINFDIQLDLGEFTEQSKIQFSKKEQYGGTIKEKGVARDYNSKNYKGVLNSKNKNFITIKNVLGNVNFQTINK